MYNELTRREVKVWWDKKCLKPGLGWKEGFVSGLVNSRAFVCLLSRNAINNATMTNQNYGLLDEDSPCDNVLLEQRLALELRQLGYIERILPIFVGDKQSNGDFGLYFETGCCPRAANVALKSIEVELREQMVSNALGHPVEPNKTVKSVLADITACQGAKIEGDLNAAVITAADQVKAMIADLSAGGMKSTTGKQVPPMMSPTTRLIRLSTAIPAGSFEEEKYSTLASENAQLKHENNQLRREILLLNEKVATFSSEPNGL